MAYDSDNLTAEQLKERILFYSRAGKSLQYWCDKYGDEQKDVFFQLADEDPKVRGAIIDEMIKYSDESIKESYSPEWLEHFPLKEVQERRQQMPQQVAMLSKTVTSICINCCIG